MRVLLPCSAALLAFAAWIWLTGPGTTLWLALAGAAIGAAVLFGMARLVNGKRGVAETGAPPTGPAP